VTIDAANVSLRQVLVRWSEIAPATFTGMERIPDESVTLRLDDVSDDAALAILLRNASAFLRVRGASSEGSRGVDRIWILPRSSTHSSDITAVDAKSSRTGTRTLDPFEPAPNEPARDNGLEPVVQMNAPVTAAAIAPAVAFDSSGRTINPAGRTAASDPPARPTPIQYLDRVDANGERVRAPSVPVVTPPPPPDGQPVPANPFGVTRGTRQPRAASPTTTGK